MNKKIIVVKSHTRKKRDSIEVRENARKAVQERWRKYYAKKGVEYRVEKKN